VYELDTVDLYADLGGQTSETDDSTPKDCVCKEHAELDEWEIECTCRAPTAEIDTFGDCTCLAGSNATHTENDDGSFECICAAADTHGAYLSEDGYCECPTNSSYNDANDACLCDWPFLPDPVKMANHADLPNPEKW